MSGRKSHVSPYENARSKSRKTIVKLSIRSRCSQLSSKPQGTARRKGADSNLRNKTRKSATHKFWLKDKPPPQLTSHSAFVSSRPEAEPKEAIERKTVTLEGTIPDVTQWAREAMDIKNSSKTINARAFARDISTSYNFRIVTDGTYWKGDIRLWENVCAWSARLPCKEKANCVFEAMRRYPSSSLVYCGLKTLFGRSMVLGDTKIPRLSLSQNAIAAFSPSLVSKKSVKQWFEYNTHVRIQETVIHMCAVSEYVLRCAFAAKERCASREFLSLVNERIKDGRDHRNRNVLCFHPQNILSELSDRNASLCLERAMHIAHKATIEGSRTACRKYGRKRVRDRQREKVKLWMLRRPLPEVLDSVVLRLESEIQGAMGIEVDIDEFRLCLTRLLRRVEGIYENIGTLEFGDEADARVPADFPRSVTGLTVPGPYTFSTARP